MTTKAEQILNPCRYALSEEARKRLRWLYHLSYEAEGNVTKASYQIGTSRQWLSTLKATFERSGRDPRSLEPLSRAPHHTDNRKRIAPEVEQKIIEVRDATPGWGKEKIARILLRDHHVRVGASTVNRYLHRHRRINPKIAEKNTRAWAQKKAREQAGEPILKVKYRPPAAIKDLVPGALVEKDMKFIIKQGQFVNFEKYKAKENFFYQHTMIDSFTRLRVLELVENANSVTAARAHARAAERFPFSIACENTDNGGENGKDFSQALHAMNVFQFYSSVGTPTDNPRVERSHLTDDQEFYRQGNSRLPYAAQRTKLLTWERRYNAERPHQALGYLTPLEFYHLWKRDAEAAHAIARKWQGYLIRQGRRLASARRMKRQEQIEALMKFIDAKLNKTVDLTHAKQALIDCQLCSWT
jgi:transposase InsO family protein